MNVGYPTEVKRSDSQAQVSYMSIVYLPAAKSAFFAACWAEIFLTGNRASLTVT